MKNFLLAGMMLGSLCSPALAQAASPAASPDVIKSCESCHGAGGNSTVPGTPRLNGQQADYIVARLKDFRDITRETPHATYNMWQVVSNLSDGARTSIAHYFAGQPPTEASPGAQAAAGRQIFENGVPAQSIPACVTCHGARGEGRGAVPRLAGQHADYLKTQLWVFSFQLRENNVMHPTTNQMHQEQMDALASYLSNN
jgi:cytochrome c553